MFLKTRLTFAFLLILASSYALSAETEQQNVEAVILHQDALFWDVYNRCDTDAFRPFFTDDVEFYHDRGGATFGADNLVTSLKNNLCGNPDSRLRREVVEGTVKVYPLQKDNVTYGAVISGQHVFYVLQKGKPERLDGLARFFHVWLVKDGVWKMARVISYDHGPAPYVNKRKEVRLSPEVLDQFAGNYIAPKSGTMTVRRDSASDTNESRLVLTINNDKSSYLLYPESENIFFTKDRNLTFEFVKNEKNQVSKMIVRESGEIAETAESSR
jgi:hypothetical protein